MKRLRLVPVSAVAACLVIGAMIGGGSYVFAAGGGGPEVVCKAAGKHLVICPKKELHGKRGKRGPQGLPGPAGPPGPAGAPGTTGATGAAGAGSGLTLNFNAKLGPSGNRSVQVGRFILRAVAFSNGHCDSIELLTGLGGEAAVSVGPNGAFVPMGANSAQPILSTETSNLFTAVTADGASTISGIVGQVYSGGYCLISGYVTGG